MYRNKKLNKSKNVPSSSLIWQQDIHLYVPNGTHLHGNIFLCLPTLWLQFIQRLIPENEALNKMKTKNQVKTHWASKTQREKKLCINKTEFSLSFFQWAHYWKITLSSLCIFRIFLSLALSLKHTIFAGKKGKCENKNLSLSLFSSVRIVTRALRDVKNWKCSLPNLRNKRKSAIFDPVQKSIKLLT